MESWKPVFHFAGGETAGNSQRFATKGEAEQSAAARFQVWTMPEGYGVERTTGPVNYRFDGETGDIAI